jgi:hypothetical protein
MKKIFFLFAALCFIVSACTSPATPQAGPTPLLEADIQATVALQVEQTLQSLPTLTLAPSNTPVVVTSTSTPTQAAPASTPTETQNPTLLTLTATLGTGTVVPGTLPFTATPSFTPTPAPIGTNHYQYYGTMPPNLPFGSISMLNKSKRDAYISLQCTTPDGYVTVIEYPVGGSRLNIDAPAGKYIYVAWVGGRKISGNFKLDKLQDLDLTIFKDRIEIK